jgi:glycosyltransferase involved in cell wall biosynthesis
VAQVPDIALVSLGTTMGLRRADQAFAELTREAGASCEVVPVRIGGLRYLRRGRLLTDLGEAYAARRSATAVRARAIIYSTITAALLQRPPGPYAVRFDSPAALNRPGTGGFWQRRREPRVLESARLLLAWSEAGARAARTLLGDGPTAVALPPPIDGVAYGGERDIDAVAYAANPHKRGLELLCEAWRDAASPGARLIVGGLDPVTAQRRLRRAGVPQPGAVEWAGPVPPERWLELVGRARVFVSASRYEDWGLAQMEALAAGTPLVTVPSPGLNEALPLARRLAPALVAPERRAGALAGALRAGLALDSKARANYAQEAAHLLEPYRRPALRRTVAEKVLPALLGSA